MIQSRRFLFLFIPLLLALACDSKETRVVARVGNHIISLADFEDSFYRKKPIGMAILNKMDVKREYLDELVDRKMKLQLVAQLGLHNEPDMVLQHQQAETRAAYIAALENRIMYQIIKEEEIASYYNKSTHEVRVRHILFATRGDTSSARIAELTQKAKEVIALLRGGGDFTDLVKQYSDDEFTTRKGGDLGYLRWGAMDSLFMEAALQSQRYQVFPRPIRTTKGLHVIQVTEKRKVVQKPYSVMRSDIVQRLFAKYRVRILDRFRQFAENLIKDYHVESDEENIKSAADFLSLNDTDSLFKSHLRGHDLELSWIPEKSREMTLVHHDNGRYTLGDFFVFLAKQTDRPPLRQIDAINIKRLVMDEIKYKITAKIGLENGYLDQYDYRAQLNEQIQETLLEKLQKDIIEKQPELSDDTLMAYYQDNLERYDMPARVEVQEILLRDSVQARNIYEQALAGADFNALATDHNTREATKMEFGRLGKITKTSYGNIGRKAHDSAVNTIQGPIKTEEGFSVIKILGKTPARRRTFDESKRLVRYDLNTDIIRQSKKKWDGVMRSRFTVRIYDEVLEQAFADLQSS